MNWVKLHKPSNSAEVWVNLSVATVIEAYEYDDQTLTRIHFAAPQDGKDSQSVTETPEEILERSREPRTDHALRLDPGFLNP